MACLKGWGARLSSLCRILSGILASLRVEVLSITHVLQHSERSAVMISWSEGGLAFYVNWLVLLIIEGLRALACSASEPTISAAGTLRNTSQA